MSKTIFADYQRQLNRDENKMEFPGFEYDTMDKFRRNLNMTKYILAKLDVLVIENPNDCVEIFSFLFLFLFFQSESVSHVEDKKISISKESSALSAICTKWMQLNVGLERLKNIITTSCENEWHEMTTTTANQMVLYSILDEFNLNDSQKPEFPIDDGIRGPGYTGVGYVSHIVNEASGIVYILDAKSMPDQNTLFGTAPKPLNRLPWPGEMFGYVFKEKYLVRAVRDEYECRDGTHKKNQYNATLIDIGCLVRIDVTPTLHNHFEVTKAAQTMPGFAKMCNLIEIPSNLSYLDLLHTRVGYEVLVIDGTMMVVDILGEGVNPFALDQQNEWNFYKHFLGNHLKMSMRSHSKADTKSSLPNRPIEKPITKRPSYVDESYNPFADQNVYKIKPITMINKNNPFYSASIEDLYEAAKSEKMFTNFQLTTNLNQLHDVETQPNELPPQTVASTPEIIIPKSAFKKQIISEENLNLIKKTLRKMMQLHKSNQLLDVCDFPQKKPPQTIANTPKIVVPDSINEKEIASDDNICKGVVKKLAEKPIEVYKLAPNVVKMECRSDVLSCRDETDKSIKVSKEQESLQHSKSTKKAPKEENNAAGPVTAIKPLQVDKTKTQSAVFSQPKVLPKIGDKIMVLYQHIENVTEFYAVVTNDPNRKMPVEEFALLLNNEKNTKRLVQYNDKCQPKKFDKVIAMYENSYYRAKVINVIDEHVFQVFYVDYGNSAKVSTLQMFKYDDKWDEYPVYALHFRINNIQEMNPWDYQAKNALQDIMIAECQAKIVDIEYSKKIDRTTYVVDLRDENALNVAETLIIQNQVLPAGKSANHLE